MEVYICTWDIYLNVEETYRTAQVSNLAALQKPAVHLCLMLRLAHC